MSKPSTGVTTMPPLRWTDCSGLRSCEPRTRACGLLTGKVPTSRGTKVLPTSVKFVLTVEKYDWAREGARWEGNEGVAGRVEVRAPGRKVRLGRGGGGEAGADRPTHDEPLGRLEP